MDDTQTDKQTDQRTAWETVRGNRLNTTYPRLFNPGA